MSKGIFIEKEDIKDLQFVDVEVLTQKEQIEKRKRDLDSAMLIGNSTKSKVQIVFETTQGTYYTETTIWAATPQFIVLKGDVSIPVVAIREIIMY